MKVRRTGGNIHRYTYQCVISKGKDGVISSWDYLLDAVTQSLVIWTSALFVIHVINMAATVVLTLVSTSKSFRKDFIKRWDVHACVFWFMVFPTRWASGWLIQRTPYIKVKCKRSAENHQSKLFSFGVTENPSITSRTRWFSRIQEQLEPVLFF